MGDDYSGRCGGVCTAAITGHSVELNPVVQGRYGSFHLL